MDETCVSITSLWSQIGSQLNGQRMMNANQNYWRSKTQQSAGTVMASVFIHAHDIIIINTLERRKTINDKYYMTLLVRICRKKYRKNEPKLCKVFFHQDNVVCHKSIATMAKLH